MNLIKINVLDEMLKASEATPGGWLGVEDVRRIGLNGVGIFDGTFRLEKVVAVNPRTKHAEVINLLKDGTPKVDWAKNEVSTRVVRMKTPEYWYEKA